MRDPFLEPMPGDVFRARSGTTHEIIDRFVTVSKSGKETQGFFVMAVFKDGRVKFGTSYRNILSRAVKHGEVIKRSRKRNTDWANVSRHTHDDVCHDMKTKHAGRGKGGGDAV